MSSVLDLNNSSAYHNVVMLQMIERKIVRTIFILAVGFSLTFIAAAALNGMINESKAPHVECVCDLCLNY